MELAIEARQRKASVLGNAVSGTVGSVLAEAILFPVDTIKLKLQTASGQGGREGHRHIGWGGVGWGRVGF